MGEQNTIGALLEEKAKRNKDKTCIYFKDDKISYKEINDISNRLANGFLKLGVNRGENVLIMLPNSLEFLYTWFGLSKIGAAEVTVNTDHKGEFLRYNIDNCDAKVMVVHGAYLDRVKLIQQNIPKLQKLVVIGDYAAERLEFAITPFNELLNSPANKPEVEVNEYDTGAIIYTSGTTGSSKGVMLSQGTEMNCARECVRYRELTADDIVHSCLPLFHGNAQGLSVLPCLIADASMVLGERFSVTSFWDEIRRYKVTQFNFIGVMLSYIYMQPPKSDDTDNPVKVAFGGPIPKDIYWEFKRRFDIRFVEPYGLSELGVIAYNIYPEHNPKIGSFGKTAPGYEVRIVDNDDNEVSPGVVGEIIARPTKPNMMMSGYYHMPDKTVEAYRNMWFHTGDYAFKDDGGYFYFADRKKDYLRVGGENISSMEVEATINTHPKIAKAAAIGVRTEGGEDAMALFLVLKPGEKLAPEELMQWAEKRLPRFAMPRYIEFVKQLPEIATEKVDKSKLKERGVGPNVWDRVKAGYKIQR